MCNQNKSFVLSVIASLLVFISCLNAQTLDQTVEELKTKYSALTSFQADFSGNYSMKGNTRNAGLNGEIFYQKENKFRIETGRRTIVSDGKKTSTYDSRMKRVVISELKDEHKQFSPEYYLVEYASKSNYELIDNKNGIKAIKFTPYESGLKFDYATLWFDSNYVIQKIEAKDPTGALFSISLSNVVLNSKIDQDIFNFVPPENVKIIDLR